MRAECDGRGLADGEKARVDGIVTGSEIAARTPGDIEQENHLRTRIVHRHVGAEQADDLDFEPRLFSCFAHCAIGDVFVVFKESGRERPKVLARIKFPLHPQNLSLFDQNHSRRRHRIAIKHKAAGGADEARAPIELARFERTAAEYLRRADAAVKRAEERRDRTRIAVELQRAEFESFLAADHRGVNEFLAVLDTLEGGKR